LRCGAASRRIHCGCIAVCAIRRIAVPRGAASSVNEPLVKLVETGAEWTKRRGFMCNYCSVLHAITEDESTRNEYSYNLTQTT